MNITTNTGKSILAALNRIAATSSKIEKEALIKEAGAQSSLFMKVLCAAYDPFKNYGITLVPKKAAGLAPSTNDLSDPMVWKCVADLAARDLSGNSARDKVLTIVNALDDDSSEVFRRIIQKDMRGGFDDGTINRCFKGTFQEFPYMRCTLPEKSNMAKWNWADGMISQEKADGSFANVNKDGVGYVWITTRQGRQYPEGILGIEADVAAHLLEGTQTHGELLVYEAGKILPREEGNGVLNSLSQGGALAPDQKVVLQAWDQIPLEKVVSKGSYERPYKERLASLGHQIVAARRAGVVSLNVVPTKVVRSKAEAYAHYRELLLKGKEGTVVKHPDMIWKDTSGNKDQVKLKLEAIVELRMKELIPAKPGTKFESTFGSVLCETECGMLKVGVSGFTDAKRLAIFNDWEERFKNSIWSVKANSIMNPSEDDVYHSLFLPRAVEERTDKTKADTLEEVREQFQAAMEAV